jgi:Phosphohistidine phosphatase SixA
MKIIVMRHGEAAHEAGRDDLRPLTDKGRKQSIRMAEWVAEQLPRIDRVLVSPFLRAQQTGKPFKLVYLHLHKLKMSMTLFPMVVPKW